MYVNYDGIRDAIESMQALKFSDAEIQQTKADILKIIHNEAFLFFSDSSNDREWSKTEIDNLVNSIEFLTDKPDKTDYKQKLMDKLNTLDETQIKKILKHLDNL